MLSFGALKVYITNTLHTKSNLPPQMLPPPDLFLQTLGSSPSSSHTTYPMRLSGEILRRLIATLYVDRITEILH